MFKEDRPGKPGLIATTLNATATFHITGPQVSAHMLVGQLAIAVLKSYQHMGSVNVTVSSLPAVPGGGCAAASDSNLIQILNSTVIDCHWVTKASQPTIQELPFDRGAVPKGHCLQVVFRVVPSVPARPEDKIKLLGLTLY